jgi:hypothetical protein
VPQHESSVSVSIGLGEESACGCHQQAGKPGAIQLSNSLDLSDEFLVDEIQLRSAQCGQ